MGYIQEIGVLCIHFVEKEQNFRKNIDIVFLIVEMAPRTRRTPVVPVEEVLEIFSNAGEALQGRMLLAIENMMKEMAQHRAEMAAQRNGDSGRQTEVTPLSVQPETSSKASGVSMIEKLAKFKKFAPKPLKETETPEEVEEWLKELEGILENLKTEEEDWVPFAEFLL